MRPCSGTPPGRRRCPWWRSRGRPRPGTARWARPRAPWGPGRASQSGSESRMSSSILPLNCLATVPGCSWVDGVGRSDQRRRVRRRSRAVLTSVLAAVDAVAHDGGGADDRCGAGDGAADDAAAGGSCGSEGHVSLLLRRGLVGLERGDDGLDRDAAAGDQLATGPASGRRERRRPGVLPDEHAGDGAGLHGLGEVEHVLLGEELGDLGLDDPQLVDLVEVVDLEGLDGAVVVLARG